MTNRRSRRPTIGTRMMARQLLADPAIVATMAVAVFVSGLVLAAAPLLFDQMADEALLEAVTVPTPQRRNISASMSSGVGGSHADDPFRGVRRAGERFRETEMSDPVQRIIEEMTWVADSPRFLVEAMPDGTEGPRFHTFIRMRYQENVEQHISLITGRMPQPRDPMRLELGPDCGLTSAEDASEQLDCAEVTVSVFEVAVTQETLEYLGVDVGGTLLLTPDSCLVRTCSGLGVPATDDSAYVNIPREDLEYNIVLRVSGRIELEGPDAVYWYGDRSLHRPGLFSNADFTFVYATGLISPADYRAALQQTRLADWSYTWRYFVAPERIEQDDVSQLSADLATLQNEFPTSSVFSAGHIGVTTNLPMLLDDYFEQRDLTVVILSMSVAGLFAIALAVIVLLSALITERQRRRLVLLRNRGSSRAQLGVSRAVQGLMVTAPPAALAYYLASTLITGDSPAPARLVVSLVAAAVLFIVVASGPVVFADLGSLQRPREVLEAGTRRRIVFEAFIVSVAIGAVVILRRRGSLGVGGREVDLLAAAAPVLLSVAVGLVTLRLYAYPIRLFARIGSELRDLVIFVGFRRVLQQPAVARLPLLVMILAVAIAAFSWVIRFSISEGQRDSTWHETGAAYRLSEINPANPLTGSFDLSAISSVEAQAHGVRFSNAVSFSKLDIAPRTVDALFLDTNGYAAVNAGTHADPHFPALLTQPPSDGAGSEGNPIPVIASERWDGRPPSLGEVFSVNLGPGTASLVVREVRETFPNMPTNRAFVVADIRSLGALHRRPTVRPTVMYVRAGPDALDELEAAVSSQSRATIVTSQAVLFDRINDAPFSMGVDRGLLMTSWLATMFAVVAAVSSLALASAGQRRDYGYLRTQGLTSRQAAWLTVIEQAPSIVVAGVVGALLGAGIAFVFEPMISFAAFTGGGLVAAPVVDAGRLLVVTFALVAILSVAAGIFGFIDRDSSLGRLIRVGDE